jgi:type III secretion protein R
VRQIFSIDAQLGRFIKIAVVMFLLRNALGIQQTPPNLMYYAIAMVLTIYIRMPRGADGLRQGTTRHPISGHSATG